MRSLKVEFKIDPARIWSVLESLITTPTVCREKEVVLNAAGEETTITKTYPRQACLYLATSNNDDKLPKADFMLRNRANGLWRSKTLLEYAFALISIRDKPKLQQLIVVLVPTTEEGLPKMLVDEGWAESFDWKKLTLDEYKPLFAEMMACEELVTIL